MFFFRRKRQNIKSKDVVGKTPTKSRPRYLNNNEIPKSYSEKTAESLFCGPEKYNCAQAVLLTFKNRFAVQDADIQSAKTMGYGRVPGGLCGALYAGKYLLSDRVTSEKLTREFERRAGSSQCKRILKLKLITCKECVALTARLIDEYSK
ncbi:hypothetical protein A7E78_05765 [Syntrophotalea acetylenivorans]|uniref:C_GCAxxG_C_C family protein n=1 Tax=Syntrophotalea acetylenivorans TaxID=1842532 RepID=A0A1L3GNB3_9BACT|nr:C-GCAxxG-C-C family (seleno)protein [Syntrophotalea acetylenivorans]APG27390.1 hypothetical protein A7E78_05765 [Syntrophotalea acetylenivorans]